jgi:hypothetical protein
MTGLGIALIVCGLTLVCAGVIFPWIVVRRELSSRESFEEGLGQVDQHVRDAPRDLDADKSEPTEPVPDAHERND